MIAVAFGKCIFRVTRTAAYFNNVWFYFQRLTGTSTENSKSDVPYNMFEKKKNNLSVRERLKKAN